MRFATRLVLLASILCASPLSAAETAFPRILRQQVLANGFVLARSLYRNRDEDLVDVGRVVFKSKKLSLNGNIACQTCHLNRFGSADGIPVAAAVGGTGEGPDRLLSGAKLLARKTLPFWGRGGVGFDTFFWDGKVDFSDGKRLSQFGPQPPSDDALITAAHLPVVEVREMLNEDAFVRSHMQESTEQAADVYRAIADNLRRFEPQASAALAAHLNKPVGELSYTDYARSLAAFIRSEFRVRETKLERFVDGTEELSPTEIRGGLVFYGRGRCVTCHYGPYFSDMKFHVVAFPQLGFGKNGFGVDYGRFNVTFDPKDLYKFRTPPLFNVEQTAPYGHSGSVATLQEAVVAHFDPLRLVNVSAMDPLARNEFYKRLALGSEVATTVGFLNDDDVDAIVQFLRTLSFAGPPDTDTPD